MRRVQIYATLWTFGLAIPFIILALIGVSFLTNNLTFIVQAISEFSRSISVGGRGLFIEFSARWPEIAGMVIGMLVLLTIYLFAQSANKSQEPKKPN